MKVPENLLSQLIQNDFTFMTGVPCSTQKDFINFAHQQPQCNVIYSANESSAIYIAAGASLLKRNSIVFLQNSTLGGCFWPLTSFFQRFHIGLLFLVSLRKARGEEKRRFREITKKYLDLLGVAYEFMSHNPILLRNNIDKACSHIKETGHSFFLLVDQGILDIGNIVAQSTVPESYVFTDENCKRNYIQDSYLTQPSLRRSDVIESILEIVTDNDIIISTEGDCCKELRLSEERDLNLYLNSCMGYTSSVSLGVSLNTSRKVFILDGDGSVLMNLSGLVSVGEYASSKLTHIVLYNNTYDSSGGQPIRNKKVDFCQIAKSLGYEQTFSCYTQEDLLRAFNFHCRNGPKLIEVFIKSGNHIKDQGLKATISIERFKEAAYGKG